MLFASALGPPLVQAQVLKGSVRADSTGAPIISAEVVFEGTSFQTRTDRLGGFRIGGITPGTYRVAVRSVGFRPLPAEAVIAAGDTIDVDFVLTPVAVELAPLEVTANKPEVLSARMREFDERRQAGFGRFLTRADLAKYGDGPVTTALRSVAGLRLTPLPCKGGYAVATARGGSEQSAKPMFCSGANGTWPVPPACYLSVYLDGVLQWSWSDASSNGSEGPPNIDEIMALNLEAVEVYRGPSELPVRFQATNSACGAVLFWTREK